MSRNRLSHTRASGAEQDVDEEDHEICHIRCGGQPKCVCRIPSTCRRRCACVCEPHQKAMYSFSACYCLVELLFDCGSLVLTITISMLLAVCVSCSHFSSDRQYSVVIGFTAFLALGTFEILLNLILPHSVRIATLLTGIQTYDLIFFAMLFVKFIFLSGLGVSIRLAVRDLELRNRYDFEGDVERRQVVEIQLQSQNSRPPQLIARERPYEPSVAMVRTNNRTPTVEQQERDSSSNTRMSGEESAILRSDAKGLKSIHASHVVPRLTAHESRYSSESQSSSNTAPASFQATLGRSSRVQPAEQAAVLKKELSTLIERQPGSAWSTPDGSPIPPTHTSQAQRSQTKYTPAAAESTASGSSSSSSASSANVSPLIKNSVDEEEFIDNRYPDSAPVVSARHAPATTAAPGAKSQVLQSLRHVIDADVLTAVDTHGLRRASSATQHDYLDLVSAHPFSTASVASTHDEF